MSTSEARSYSKLMSAVEPHIARLHDLLESEDVRYLGMQSLTVADRPCCQRGRACLGRAGTAVTFHPLMLIPR
jgi:hypothetical protein